jgi:hypothetical protein
MQQTEIHPDHPAHWTHGMALERRLGLPRGMLLVGPRDGDSVINRVLSAAHLDSATLDQLASILTVTVRDWLRK